MASGSLAEVEAIFELRLPLTMVFRIVRSLKNSGYQAKLSESIFCRSQVQACWLVFPLMRRLRMFQSRRCEALQAMT